MGFHQSLAFGFTPPQTILLRGVVVIFLRYKSNFSRLSLKPCSSLYRQGIFQLPILSPWSFLFVVQALIIPVYWGGSRTQHYLEQLCLFRCESLCLNSAWNVLSCLEAFVTLVLLLLYFAHTACGILIPWPGVEPVSPALEVQSLNHWTAREIPHLFFSENFCIFTSFVKPSLTSHPGLQVEVWVPSLCPQLCSTLHFLIASCIFVFP